MRPVHLAARLVALALLAAPPAAADQLITDDLIVQDSSCVGPGCQAVEDFGFDTLRLKGDVLRVRFVDTSNSASFPSNDWQLTVNDDDAGTADRFSLEDLDAGTTPFTVEAGAPTHSLYVAGDGRVGVGTGTPSPTAALHVEGTLQADAAIDVGGAVTAGLKAGVVPASEFVKGEATVTFQAPYAGDYLVLLTPVSATARRRFQPAVLGQDASGFTLTAGKRSTRHLVEVHWMAQPVGE